MVQEVGFEPTMFTLRGQIYRLALHNRSNLSYIWYTILESNQVPSAYKTDALTNELMVYGRELRNRTFTRVLAGRSSFQD